MIFSLLISKMAVVSELAGSIPDIESRTDTTVLESRHTIYSYHTGTTKQELADTTRLSMKTIKPNAYIGRKDSYMQSIERTATGEVNTRAGRRQRKKSSSTSQWSMKRKSSRIGVDDEIRENIS